MASGRWLMFHTAPFLPPPPHFFFHSSEGFWAFNLSQGDMLTSFCLLTLKVLYLWWSLLSFHLFSFICFFQQGSQNGTCYLRCSGNTDLDFTFNFTTTMLASFLIEKKHWLFTMSVAFSTGRSRYFSDTPQTSLCTYQYLVSPDISLVKLHVQDLTKHIWWQTLNSRWRRHRTVNARKIKFTEQHVPSFICILSVAFKNLTEHAMISFLEPRWGRIGILHTFFPKPLPLPQLNPKWLHS